MVWKVGEKTSQSYLQRQQCSHLTSTSDLAARKIKKGQTSISAKEEGDLLTIVDIYEKWNSKDGKREQNKWCV